jgi:hypothetical protein
MSDASLPRRFIVHAAHEGAHHGHRVEEASFEAAAVAFVERWSPALDADGEVSVVVVDQESGRQHCFRIDADTGESGPCE